MKIETMLFWCFITMMVVVGLNAVSKNACAEELVLEKKPQVSSGTKGS